MMNVRRRLDGEIVEQVGGHGRDYKVKGEPRVLSLTHFIITATF